MITYTANSVKWLQFGHLSEIKKLSHGIFFRPESQKVDKTEAELAIPTINIQHAKEVLEIKSLFFLNQIHSDEIIEASVSIYDPQNQLKGDSLVTSEENLGLAIKHADCQAAIIYDPILHVLASVHSGWRGSVKNIYGKTIVYMKAKYGSNPANLLVGISPSLGPEAAEFKNFSSELPSSFWNYQIKPNYFNFWEISKRQLVEAGVLEPHIEIASICTYSNPKDWFSYRYNRECGRNITLAALKGTN